MQVYSCRVCNKNNLRKILDLGYSPLANNLLSNTEETEELYPLVLEKCDNCHNCQLNFVVDPEKLFKNYLYVSSTTKNFRDHFYNASKQYIKDYKLNKESFVIDIGSNDGISLKHFKENNIKILGIDPAENIVELANKNGINTINSFFDENIASTILKDYGKADIVMASNVFAHSDNLKKMAKNVFKILKDDGIFIIEVQYLLNTLKDLTFDNIYHEHVNYWSLTSLNFFFNLLGFKVFKAELINTHGGSIRVFVDLGHRKIEHSVYEILNKEEEYGIKTINPYVEFAEKVKNKKINIIKNIQKLKINNKVIGYGAPAKATTALNYYNITTSEIEYIIEDNSLKHNKFIPNVKIPIFSKDKINKNKIDIVLVLAWNFFDEIVKNNKELIERGIKFINIKDLENEDFDCSSNI